LIVAVTRPCRVWVDQKLDGIVDELVKAEIAKAVEQAGVF
jgi:hypothetical protein